MGEGFVTGIADSLEVGAGTEKRLVASVHTASGGVEEDRSDQGSLAWDRPDVRPRSPDAKHQPQQATAHSGP